MIVEHINNTTIITQENESINDLIAKIEARYEKFKMDNLIVNSSTLNTFTADQAIEFLQLYKTHRAKKLSFVIVNAALNVNEAPEEPIVVPTLKEAHDIIEMENIERDLEL